MNLNDDLGVVFDELRLRVSSAIVFFKGGFESDIKSVRLVAYVMILNIVVFIVCVILILYTATAQKNVSLLKSELLFLRDQHGELLTTEEQGDKYLGAIQGLDSKSTASNFISLVSLFAGKYNISVSSLGDSQPDSFGSQMKTAGPLAAKRVTLHGVEYMLQPVPFEFEGGYIDFVKMRTELAASEVLWSLDRIKIEILSSEKVYKPVFTGQFIVFSRGSL